MGKVVRFRNRERRALLLCRDAKLNEPLRKMWESVGYRVDVVNDVANAHVWWDRNIKKWEKEDFQVCLVLLNGKSRDYWYIFLNTIAEEFMPPVEICF